MPLCNFEAKLKVQPMRRDSIPASQTHRFIQQFGVLYYWTIRICDVFTSDVSLRSEGCKNCGLSPFWYLFFHGLLQIPRLLTCIINNQSLTILQGLRVRIFDHWVPACRVPILHHLHAHPYWQVGAPQFTPSEEPGATLGWLENVGKHWEGTRAPPRFWARKKHSFHWFPDVCWCFNFLSTLWYFAEPQDRIFLWSPSRSSNFNEGHSCHRSQTLANLMVDKWLRQWRFPENWGTPNHPSRGHDLVCLSSLSIKVHGDLGNHPWLQKPRNHVDTGNPWKSHGRLGQYAFVPLHESWASSDWESRFGVGPKDNRR